TVGPRPPAPRSRPGGVDPSPPGPGRPPPRRGRRRWPGRCRCWPRSPAQPGPRGAAPSSPGVHVEVDDVLDDAPAVVAPFHAGEVAPGPLEVTPAVVVGHHVGERC